MSFTPFQVGDTLTRAVVNARFQSAHSEISANKSNADARFAKAGWAQIGSANLAGLAANAVLTVTLSRNISVLTEMLIVCSNFVSSSGNPVTLNFSDTFSKGDGYGPALTSSRVSDAAKFPARGVIYIVLGVSEGEAIGFDAREYSMQAQYIFDEATSVLRVVGTSNKLIGHSTSNYGVSSGELVVYGRCNA